MASGRPKKPGARVKLARKKPSSKTTKTAKAAKAAKAATGRSKKKAVSRTTTKKLKAKTRAKAKSPGSASRSASLPASAPAPAPTPTASERVLARCGELPTERAITDEERDAMRKVSETARRFVGTDGEPRAIVLAIASFLDDVRMGKREEPRSQDVRLGLGVLWGEQLRAEVGWRWVHLTYPDGFASYALVPDDRAFACFPLNRVPDALRPTNTNTSAHVFESIKDGDLPSRRQNTYLVIG